MDIQFAMNHSCLLKLFGCYQNHSDLFLRLVYCDGNSISSFMKQSEKVSTKVGFHQLTLLGIDPRPSISGVSPTFARCRIHAQSWCSSSWHQTAKHASEVRRQVWNNRAGRLWPGNWLEQGTTSGKASCRNFGLLVARTLKPTLCYLQTVGCLGMWSCFLQNVDWCLSRRIYRTIRCCW